MGNKICFHPRVIVTEGIALHFRSSNLKRDVLPIVDKWRSDGAELCLRPAEFQATFDVVKDLERQFKVFDTSGSGCADAYEVLMVYILLCTGDLEAKVDAVFSVFDFAGCRGHMHSLNFQEALMLLEACVKGLQKVCELDVAIGDDEILFYCKSLFDMHHVPHTARIQRLQFKQWCLNDPSPKAFIQLFQDAQGLPDVHAQVQHVNMHQGRVFQSLARGNMCVTVDALRASQEWQRSLYNASDEEVEALLDLMADTDGRIALDRFHSVLRAWNIFNECDLDRSGSVDKKEMEILLWIFLRRKPEPHIVKLLYDCLDEDLSGSICRREWTQAIISSHRGEMAARVSVISDSSPPLSGAEVA